MRLSTAFGRASRALYLNPGGRKRSGKHRRNQFRDCEDSALQSSRAPRLGWQGEGAAIHQAGRERRLARAMNQGPIPPRPMDGKQCSPREALRPVYRCYFGSDLSRSKYQQVSLSIPAATRRHRIFVRASQPRKSPGAFTLDQCSERLPQQRPSLLATRQLSRPRNKIIVQRHRSPHLPPPNLHQIVHQMMHFQ